jgi:hypothetical protein
MVELAVAGVLAYGVIDLASRGKLTRSLWTVGIATFAFADGLATALVRRLRPPRFSLLGDCVRCGECCRMIIGDPPKLVKQSALLSLYVGWHRIHHAFRVVGRGPQGEVIFSCGHLRADGRCGIYARRPLLCRNYPVLSFFEPPRLLPACSYRAAPRVVASMRPRAALAIVNPGVTVHHPTREKRGELGRDEDYEWLDDTPPAAGGGRLSGS